VGGYTSTLRWPFLGAAYSAQFKYFHNFTLLNWTAISLFFYISTPKLAN